MATLKDSNPKAVEFFASKGRKFIELDKGLENFQLSEKELGDLELREIRKWAGAVGKNLDKGMEVLEREEEIWRKQVENLYIASHPSIPEGKEAEYKEIIEETARSGILVEYDDAARVLNLISLFKKILVGIRRSQTQAETYKKNLSDVKNSIIEAIKSNNKAKISAESADLARFIPMFLDAKASYLDAVEAYEKATSWKLKAIDLTPFSSEELEEFYYETIKAIKTHSKEKDADIVGALRVNLGHMANLIGAEKAKEMSEKAEARVNKEFEDERVAKEKEVIEIQSKEFRKVLKGMYEIVYKNAVNKYKQPNWDYPPHEMSVAAIYETIGESSLPKDVKEKIARECFAEYIQRLNKYLGEKQHRVTLAVIEISNEINALNKMSLDDPKLKATYERILANIGKLAKSKAAVEVGLVVEPHNENGYLFKFKDSKVADFMMPEISKEIINKLNPKPVVAPAPEPKPKEKPVVAPAPEPKPKEKPVVASAPEPKPEDKPVADPKPSTEEADLQAYLDLLAATNAKIEIVNEINNKLISHNVLRNLTSTNIVEDVNAEQIAETATTTISLNRLQLAEKRYGFLKAYGKYIIADPKVKDKKIEEVKFNTNFEEFVNDRDNLIVDAEMRILELSNNKPKDYEKDIANLMEFIKAQNSLISRFLVAESVSRKIDIVKFQNERMAKRASLIEQRKAALVGGKPEPKPVEEKPVVAPAPEAKPVEEKPVVAPAPEVKPVEEKPVEEAPTPVKKDIEMVKIKHAKLTFNPRHTRAIDYKIQDSDVLFKDSPKITVELIKNGVKVKMSQQLRERLAELNAKISLVNTKEKRMRTSRMVDGNAEEQEVTFKKDHDVDFDNYNVEIRIPGKDRSQLLFGEETPTEEIHMSR